MGVGISYMVMRVWWVGEAYGREDVRMYVCGWSIVYWGIVMGAVRVVVDMSIGLILWGGGVRGDCGVVVWGVMDLMLSGLRFG